MSVDQQPPTVLVATRNPGKLRELVALFGELGVHLTDLSTLRIPETPLEDGLEVYASFEENALAKARHFHSATGLPTVADDSGLAVDVLGGAPGVHSKRFAGASGPADAVERANNAKLLSSLRGLAAPAARFVCAAAYVDDRSAVTCRGTVEGWIVDDARGDDGFGYDPYFFSPELGMTFGEADIASKQRVSHRARAFRALVEQLRARGHGDGLG